ncbi:MAG: tetratricopeptide repeat protein [Actinobacteria bacterium]|nr:tetratricopeptide repeat protein [Actinomycetota bacterium]
MSNEGGQALPSGTVTFVFTDMERSTTLLQSVGEERYARLREGHHKVLRRAFEKHGGVEFESEGDAFFVAFSRAGLAVAAALAAQLEMHQVQPEVKVRMGIHTGHASVSTTGYIGLSLHQTARIAAAGHGGQVLVSEATRPLVGEADLPMDAGFLDLGQHRFKDLSAPLRIYQLTHPGLPDDFPPIRSLEARAHNLPIQLTSLVGRDEEIEEISRLLDANRLVTLAGAAGCGKTRLALHVAAELLDRYPDGVWLAELSQSSDPQDVPMKAAEAVGLRFDPGPQTEANQTPDVTESLQRYLEPKRLLLVLDNCEHLLTACAGLAHALLQTCPGVKVLTTSREALGVAGESSLRVPSLSVPDPSRVPPLEELTDYEAVRLFVERAALAEPGFGLTEDTSEAVVQICHRLDGMPLGIELAAAKVRMLTPQQIADRLDEMFRILTGGGRVALERQQTLRAAVDWSYRLLAEPEKLLLQRLSVFVGGFDLEAAEEVCSGDGIEGDQVLDLLTHLVDASFVVRLIHRGKSRYRLLETIRQYAREKLFDSESSSAIRNRHRDFYLGVAVRMSEEMFAGRTSRANEIADDEVENLLVALDWSIGEGHVDEALRLGYSLAMTQIPRARFWEFRRQYEEVLDISAGEETPPRADALAFGGEIAAHRGDPGARRMATEAVALFRKLGDRAGLGRALSHLGETSLRLGDTEADDAFAEALPILRETEQNWWIARTLVALARLAWTRDDLEEARSRSEEAFQFARANRIQYAMLVAGYDLGSIQIQQGDYEGARSSDLEILALAEELNLPNWIAEIQIGLGRLAQWQGDHEEATSIFERALASARGSGHPIALGIALDKLGYAAVDRGEFQQARSYWEEARGPLSIVGASPGHDIRHLYALGWVALLEGDLAAARPHLEEALAVVRTMESKHLRAAVLHMVGELNRLEGNIEEARNFLEEGLALAREAAHKFYIANVLSGLGEVARIEGNHSKALDHHREAIRLSVEIGNKFGLAESLQALGALAAAVGRPREASRLLGAAEALFESTGAAVAPISVQAREEAIAQTKPELSTEEFEAEREKGRAMGAEEAVDYALSEDLGLG